MKQNYRTEFCCSLMRGDYVLQASCLRLACAKLVTASASLQPNNSTVETTAETTTETAEEATMETMEIATTEIATQTAMGVKREIYRVVVAIGCVRDTRQSCTREFGVLHVTVSRQGRAPCAAPPKPVIEPFIESFIEPLQNRCRTNCRVVHRAVLEPLRGRYRAVRRAVYRDNADPLQGRSQSIYGPVAEPFIEIMQSHLYRRLYGRLYGQWQSRCRTNRGAVAEPIMELLQSHSQTHCKAVCRTVAEPLQTS